MLGQPTDWTLSCDTPEGWLLSYARMDAPVKHGELVAVAEATRGTAAAVRIGVASLEREVSPQAWLAVLVEGLGESPRAATSPWELEASFDDAAPIARRWCIKKHGPRLIVGRALMDVERSIEAETAALASSLTFKRAQVCWAEPLQAVTPDFHEATSLSVPLGFAPQPSFAGERGMVGERWISDFGRGMSGVLEAVEIPKDTAGSPEAAVDLVLQGELGRYDTPLAHVPGVRDRLCGTWLADGGKVEVCAVVETWGDRFRIFCCVGPSRLTFVGAWLINRRAHHLLVASQSDELDAVTAGVEPGWARTPAEDG